MRRERAAYRGPRHSRGTLALAMPQLRSHLAILTVALLLGGCSWMDSVLTGEDTSQDDNSQAQSDTVQIPQSPAEQNPQPTVTQAPVSPPAPAPGAPAVGAGNYAAQPATPGTGAGTYVGQKVVALRADLQRLQASINQHNQELQQTRQAMASDSTAYYNTVAAINTRLQVGSTPGNPELVQQW